MLDRLLRVLIVGVMSLCFLPSGAWAQAPAKGPQVKDQAEYDIAQAAAKETDAQKKLDLLHQWEQKYPDSDFKGNRSLQIAQVESQIAGKAMTASPSAADLDAAQKAAQDLADNLDKYLAPENKPAGATDAQWAAAKLQIGVQAHTVLATVDASKKNDAGAEGEFKKVLALDPNSAASAYALGTTIYRQKNLARIPEALFWIARSTQISGPEALNAQGKAAADKFLKQAYAGYHGSEGGLADLEKVAATATTMPADLKIESQVDIANKAAGDEEAFNKAHPDLALWHQIRDALKADNGADYFTQVKGSEIPPAGAFTMFTGKVVSQPSPKEVLLNVDNGAGDVVLRFENPLKGTLDPGTEVKFKGVVEEFAKDPYVLTLSADKDDVDGIPATAFAGAPPPRRRPTKK